ncbi:hypothetical protein ACFO4O_14980 [Glaciecola siphonariae]|uniref:Porin n=1 Tax=Glaciecola siphonariae TaxID=521012 RepID=A0ABV9M1E1_9ALTE
MYINSKNLLLTVCLYACINTSVVNADAPEFEFSGFANIGLTYSNSDVYGFRTQLINEGREGLSLTPDSLLGVQTNVRFSDDFDFVAQVVAQDRTERSLGNFVELAFLRYQINRNWAVKAGRFSTNSYLFTDSRYVSQASYWVRPPVEMYSTAGSLGNMDGAKIAYTHETPFGYIRLSASLGQSELNNDSDSGEFEISYQDLLGLNIELQSDDWRFQVAYLNANLDDFNFAQLEEVRQAPLIAPAILAPFFQEVETALIPDGRRVSYFSIGGKYYFDSFEVTAEFGDYDSDWAFSPGSRFGYASLAYTSNNIMPFVTVAASSRKEEPVVIDVASLQGQLPPPLLNFLAVSVEPANKAAAGASVSQQSISAGFRWDFDSDWALKAQFDHYRIDENGSGLFLVLNDGFTIDQKTSYNVWSIGLATTF